MKHRSYLMIAPVLLVCFASCVLSSCKARKADATAEAPPPAQVEHEQYGGPFKVDHPEQFPLATAGEYKASSELNVAGIVSLDLSRNPIFIASGRVGDIRGPASGVIAGQHVTNAGSGVLPVSRQAAAFTQSSLLAVHRCGNESASKLAGPKRLPVSRRAALQSASDVQGSGSPNPLAISDLSRVWVLCDVYEKDLPFVRLGEYADIHLDGYPDLILKGRIGNIGPSRESNLRTAKVRLEVENPGILRLGMFVTATFYGVKKEVHATVPASAVLHLHDRDYVYVPLEGGRFQRVDVVVGKMLPGTARAGASLVGAPGRAVAAASPPQQDDEKRQEIISGLRPRQQVVANALALQVAVEQ
jgi:cobalt-zinc-cadmium efflux system membrane fusion protein